MRGGLGLILSNYDSTDDDTGYSLKSAMSLTHELSGKVANNGNDNTELSFTFGASYCLR